MSPTTADRYAAIERLYSLGQWQQVLDESEALLAGLTGNNASSLRQRLLLLQGHTRLHGLGQIDAASALYQQVLDSQPEPVLLAVAQQQLARAQTMTETADPAVEPAVEPAPREPTLLRQAFPFTAEAVGTAPPGQPAAAAPWLESLSQPKPEPAPQPQADAPAPAPPWLTEPPAAAPTPVEVIEVIEEPEQIAVHQADPDRAQIVDLAPWSPAEEAELARGLLEVVLR
jgi:hypothetical protein